MNRLKELRGNKSQQEIASAIGIKRGAYYWYETGEHEMGYEHMVLLADYFNVSIDYLMGRTNDSSPFNPTPLSTTEMNLVEMYRKMNPEQKNQFYGFVMGLLSAQGKDCAPFVIEN